MVPDAPAPGSHDRSTPSGTLEESAANLFEAMLAARAAEDRGEGDARALRDFYRALMGATLLLPVPPDHGDEAKAAPPLTGWISASLAGLDGRTFGSVHAIDGEAPFTDLDEAVLVHLAQMASAAIERALLYEGRL